MEDDSFAVLKSRLSDGKEDAAIELFDRFAGQLVVLARNHLSERFRRKVDPEDVMQSVLKSFFSRKDEFELSSWNSLWGLLVVIALRKCGRKIEVFQTAARDVNREVSDDSRAIVELTASDPTPAEAIILAETVEQLGRGLSERDQEILTLRLQGFTVREIKSQIGRSERTIHRVLSQLKHRLAGINNLER